MSETVRADDLHAGDWIMRDGEPVWITRRRVDGDMINLGTGRGTAPSHKEMTIPVDTPMTLITRWPHPVFAK